jgi:hypothetical protein
MEPTTKAGPGAVQAIIPIVLVVVRETSPEADPVEVMLRRRLDPIEGEFLAAQPGRLADGLDQGVQT